MVFKIELLEAADKDLQSFHLEDQRAIVKKIREQLTLSPFPHGKTIKRLQGFGIAIYRLRVNAKSQSYRVFYQIQTETVRILRISGKKDADQLIQSLKRSLD